jgi:hypothetical protein
MGEIRYVAGSHRPVVGVPSFERGDKRVTSVEILPGGGGPNRALTNLRLTVERPRPTPASPVPKPSTRNVRAVRHVDCYPSGVLLLTENLHLDNLPPHSIYLMPNTRTARHFSKAYYVEQEVYDSFLASRVKGAGDFDVLEDGDFEDSSPTSSSVRMASSPTGSRGLGGAEMDVVEGQHEKQNELGAAWDMMNMELGDVRVMMNLKSREGDKDDIFLQVRVVEGKGLKAMDMNGLSDPYCVVYVADDEGQKIDTVGEFRTHTVQRTLTPFWNDAFDIGSNCGIRVDDYTLVVEVWDADKWSSDDMIGTVRIPLWNIPQRWDHQPPVDMWMPLHPGKSWMKTEVESIIHMVTEQERVSAICQYSQRRTVATIDATLLKLGNKWRDNVTNDYYMPELVAAGVGGFVDRIWMEVQVRMKQKLGLRCEQDIYAAGSTAPTISS